MQFQAVLVQSPEPGLVDDYFIGARRQVGDGIFAVSLRLGSAAFIGVHITNLDGCGWNSGMRRVGDSADESCTGGLGDGYSGHEQGEEYDAHNESSLRCTVEPWVKDRKLIYCQARWRVEQLNLSMA